MYVFSITLCLVNSQVALIVMYMIQVHPFSSTYNNCSSQLQVCLFTVCIDFF